MNADDDFLITNQNASLIKEFKNTPIWWKEPSDWPKSSTNQNDRNFAGKNEMGRPENEKNSYKKQVFFFWISFGLDNNISKIYIFF